MDGKRQNTGAVMQKHDDRDADITQVERLLLEGMHKKLEVYTREKVMSRRRGAREGTDGFVCVCGVCLSARL